MPQTLIKFCYKENAYTKTYITGSSCYIGGCVWWESWTESGTDLIIIKCYTLESKAISLIFYPSRDTPQLITIWSTMAVSLPVPGIVQESHDLEILAQEQWQIWWWCPKKYLNFIITFRKRCLFFIHKYTDSKEIRDFPTMLPAKLTTQPSGADCCQKSLQ